MLRCAGCSCCDILLLPGFCSEERLWCTELSRYVEPDDDCTFGEEGAPVTATDGVSATLGGHECVRGDHE